MASMELDPIFSKALKLLHSKNKDSEDQLRAMLEDAIKQRHGNAKLLGSSFMKKEGTSKRESSKTTPSTTVRKDELRKESEKKSFEKIEETSKPFSNRNTTPSPSQHDDDDDGLALEILEEDLTCVVCRGMDVGVRNQLVECIECHSLYHQECHQPTVAEADMNDPRSAWYCSQCTKAMSKVQGAGKPAATVGSSGAQSSYSSTGGKPSFSSSVNKTPSFSTSAKSFGGLSAPPTKSKSSAAAASSQKCVVPNINIISADKRLQIMKKKAAKMQEKRKHSK